MKKIYTLIIGLFLANSLIAQHFGGLYMSAEWIPSHKPLGTTLEGNYFKDHNFSMGYTVGYQGLVMESRRFSFTYGLQYNYRASYQNNFGAPYGCATGVDFENYVPSKLDETWQNLEVPLTARYNIVKNKKLQPYVSLGFVPFYTLVRKTTQTAYSGEVLHESNRYKNRIDMAVQMAVGLNYKTKNFILNVQPSYRPWYGYEKIALGLAIMRRL